MWWRQCPDPGAGTSMVNTDQVSALKIIRTFARDIQQV